MYRFDRTADREPAFAVDTPPPTVSGSIHMGTIFGYTQFDAIARFQRMAGRQVFFPIGWDDNGLATERRVQNYFGVRCDPSRPYEPDFQPPYRGDVPDRHQELPVSRPVPAVRSAPGADRDPRGRVRRHVPPTRHVVRLVAGCTTTIYAQPPHEPARLPAQPCPR